MGTSPSTEKSIEAILSLHEIPPRILKKDGLPLTAGEHKSLVLRSENYTVESRGLDLLNGLFASLHSAEAKEQFWESLLHADHESQKGYL